VGFVKLSSDAEISPDRTHIFLMKFLQEITDQLKRKGKEEKYLLEDATKVHLANLEKIFNCFEGKKNANAENYLTGA
jgi:hypothetical protein